MVKNMKNNSPKILFTLLSTILIISSSNIIIAHAQDPGPGMPNPPDSPYSGSEDAPGKDDSNANPSQDDNSNADNDQSPGDKPGEDNQDEGQHPSEDPQQEKEGADNSQGSESDDKGQNQQKEQNQNGQMGQDTTITEKQQRYEKRVLTITQSMNQTRIRSTWEQDNDQDNFDILIDTEEKPRIHFEYYNNNNSNENNLSYQLVFKDIREFEDINNNGFYDDDDTLISIYSLENASFQSMNHENMTSDDGKNISAISIGTLDNMFRVRFYATESYAYIQNSLCTPSEVKMDFIIDNYLYQRNSTRLSLTLELQTKSEIDLDAVTFDELKGYATNESQFTVSTGTKSGFFSWIDTVDVDNHPKQVYSTSSSEKKQFLKDDEIDITTTNTISFSYPPGENIIHDPKIGIISLSSESYAASELAESIAILKVTSMYSYLIVCMIAAILFIGIIYYRKKV